MWGVIPAYIRRNRSISDKAKLLYAEITDLTNENGECLSTNEDLARHLGCSDSTLRRYLYELRDFELICVDGESKDRKITFPEKMVLVEVSKPVAKKVETKRTLTEKIVESWNSVFFIGLKGIRVTPQLLATVTSRSKSFSEEEILIAVNNRIAFVESSEWHNLPENAKHKKNIYLVLRADKELEKNLMTPVLPKEDSNVINVYRF